MLFLCRDNRVVLGCKTYVHCIILCGYYIAAGFLLMFTYPGAMHPGAMSPGAMSPGTMSPGAISGRQEPLSQQAVPSPI